MTGRSLAILTALLGLAWQGPALAHDRFEAARMNYQAVVNGSKQIAELSPQELADINELDRRLRGQAPDNRTTSQRCVDAEIKRADGAVTALARRVIDLKCREAGE